MPLSLLRTAGGGSHHGRSKSLQVFQEVDGMRLRITTRRARHVAYFLFAAIVGFATCGLFGLLASPMALWYCRIRGPQVINSSIKNRYPFVAWLTWFLVGIIPTWVSYGIGLFMARNGMVYWEQVKDLSAMKERPDFCTEAHGPQDGGQLGLSCYKAEKGKLHTQASCGNSLCECYLLCRWQ